jgi:FtsZ-interacting cell division protein ZipA
VIILIVAIIAIAFAAWMFIERERTRKLRTRFGSEYDRLVEENRGSARRAESELERRQKRVEKLAIRPLSREESDRFATEWRHDQERFVDDPRAAIARADELVSDAMRARGYPMGEFEQRAADISVDHPRVVEHYRVAHEIAVQDRDGKATTEDLRNAMLHYRRLFEEILDQPVKEREEAHR